MELRNDSRINRSVLLIEFLQPGLPLFCVPRELDASVGASGPHDFSVREIGALVLSAARVHRIPLQRP